MAIETVLGQAQLNSGGKKYQSVWKGVEVEIAREVIKGIFWSNDNVLYLELMVGYLGVYICQNSSNETLDICTLSILLLIFQ